MSFFRSIAAAAALALAGPACAQAPKADAPAASSAAIVWASTSPVRSRRTRCCRSSACRSRRASTGSTRCSRPCRCRPGSRSPASPSTAPRSPWSAARPGWWAHRRRDARRAHQEQPPLDPQRTRLATDLRRQARHDALRDDRPAQLRGRCRPPFCPRRASSRGSYAGRASRSPSWPA